MIPMTKHLAFAVDPTSAHEGNYPMLGGVCFADRQASERTFFARIYARRALGEIQVRGQVGLAIQLKVNVEVSAIVQ